MEFTLSKSSRAGKKFMIKHGNKTIHFGSSDYEDYTQHGDDDRKQKYLARHKKREDWDDPLTAGFWSAHLLWNMKTIPKAIKDIEKRFKIKIINNIGK
jgi:hypothetical protein